MLEIPKLRINDCGVADYPTGGRLGPRVLRDFEILWIERGRCLWQFDGETHECLPGSILLCPTGMQDVWVWDAEHTTRHGFIHFDFLDDFSAHLPSRRNGSDKDVVRPLLRHAIWLASLGGRDNEALAAQALRQALVWFVNGQVEQDEQAVARDLHPVIHRALRALKQSWGDGPKHPPSIQQWADDTGISRGHLSRICRQELNVTPQELLRYLRLDHGLMLVARTNMKINQISEVCGFQSQFHFSRCFKETYGGSPRDVRQKLRAGGDQPLRGVFGLRRAMHIVG